MQRAARRAALRLDGRIEGFSAPSSRMYEHVITPALGWLYRRATDDVAAEIVLRGLGGGATILDVGCGPGDLAVQLAARLPEARIVGLDRSPNMVALAGHQASAGGRLRFVLGDAADLPFEAGTFDIVVSTLSLHHWAAPDACFAEIGRVLRPGGLALVYDLRLLTVASDGVAAIAAAAGLAPDELRLERLGGSALDRLIARFRLEVPAGRP